ncbi:DNRLRE domain-containing protein [Paenibacillus gansuensis]|uniref:DNRLRE domain-containing protein n=1 Tax=Paenibacillus gansuensis TaxID=306542 RepID=A0ABW5PGF5_9BACL
MKKTKVIVSTLLLFPLLTSIVCAAPLTYSSTTGLIQKQSKSTVSDSVYSETNTGLPSGNDKIIKELVENRTSNSKVYLKEDGSYKAVITATPQHYEDSNGQFQDINLKLIDEADIDTTRPITSKQFILANQREGVTKLSKDRNVTSYRALQIPYDVKIPKDYSKGYSIGKGQDKLTFIPQDAATVTGSVYKNSIIYNSVWRETNVEIDVKENGLKETLVVQSEAAPHTFSFEVKGQLSNNFTSEEFVIKPAWLEDSVGNRRDVSQHLRREGNKTYIDFSYENTGLIYPLKIDPTVVVQPDSRTGKDAEISNYYYSLGRNFGSDTTAAIGHANDGTDRGFFVQFPINTFQGHVITSAQLKLYMFAISYPPAEFSTVNVHNVTSAWSEDTITWVNSFNIYESNSVAKITNISRDQANYWWNFDVTSLVSQWSNGSVTNNGMYLDNTATGYWNILTSEYSDASLRPQLVVNYVPDPPTAPVIISPSNGQILDGVSTIVWNASTDPLFVQSSLRYQIQLSTNGGANWSDIISLTNSGTVSYNYDFSGVTATTNAVIRIRGCNGEVYGNWGTSSNFTIKHNQPPNQPSNLSPGSDSLTSPLLIAGTSPALNWSFSDPDAGDTQSAYQIEIYNGSTLVKDSGWVSSSTSSYTVPISTLVPNVSYSWRVRTKDKKGAISAFSNSKYIKTNSLPTLSITSYSDGQIVPDNVLSFTWTYSDANGQTQSAYRVQGSKDNWASVNFDSGSVSGIATSFTTAPLANGQWDFRISVSDGMEWSQWRYRNDLQLPSNFEPNDTQSASFPVLYNTPYSTLISSSSDIDWYSYSPSQSGVDEVLLTVPAGLNYDVYIYDKNMNLLAFGARSPGVAEDIIYKVNSGTAEKYYIKVVGVGGNASTTAQYTLNVARMNLNYQTIYLYDENGNIKSKTTTVGN